MYRIMLWSGIVLWIFESTYFGFNTEPANSIDQFLDTLSLFLALFGGIGSYIESSIHTIVNKITPKETRITQSLNIPDSVAESLTKVVLRTIDQDRSEKEMIRERDLKMHAEEKERHEKVIKDVFEVASKDYEETFGVKVNVIDPQEPKALENSDGELILEAKKKFLSEILYEATRRNLCIEGYREGNMLMSGEEIDHYEKCHCEEHKSEECDSIDPFIRMIKELSVIVKSADENQKNENRGKMKSKKRRK